MNKVIRKYNFIYKTVNLINGKIYVGQHKTDDLDDGYIGTGILITRAIKKHGRENFSFEILEYYYGVDQKEIDELEVKWIAYFDCVKPKGYNITIGGGGCPGYNHTEEHKVYISEKLSGRKMPEENRLKLIKALTGRKMPEYYCKEKSIKMSGEGNPFFDKHHNQETKDIIAVKRSKGSILQIDTNTLEILRVWVSGEQILRELSSGTPFSICKGKRLNKIYKGCYWVFESEFNESKLKEIIECPDNHNGRKAWNKGLPAWNKGKTGIFTEEQINKIKERKTGDTWKEESKTKFKETLKNKPIEICEHCGFESNNHGYMCWKHHDNCKDNPDRKEQEPIKCKIVTCPHCSESGGGPNMTRYHFNNCPRKKLADLIAKLKSNLSLKLA